MEENTSLFSLSIDTITKENLLETARWARFLAIVGFVFLAFIVVFGIYFSLLISRYGMISDSSSVMGAAGAGIAIMYLIGAAIAFFPLLFTLRFANQMRNALNSNNQSLLNTSFQNLKSCFRYLGVITIISLVMMALSMVFGVAGLALS
jgi:hypothetical protein